MVPIVWWLTFQSLHGFWAPAPEVKDCWRTQDLVKIGHTLQIGMMGSLSDDDDDDDDSMV